MSLIIRVTSADNTKVFTRKLEGATPRITIPQDAKFAIVDEVTGEVIPVTPRYAVNASGEQELVFVFENEGEEIAVAVAQGEAWPVDTQLALNEGLAAPEAIATANLEARRAGADLDTAEAQGQGGLGTIGYVLFGAIAIGAIAVAASSGGEDDPAIIPPTPDTTPPAAPTGLDLATASDPDGDNLVGTGTGLVITGTAEANSSVRLLANDVLIGTVAAGSNGAFTFTVTLPEGTTRLTATATDLAGNISVASAPLAVIVDTTAPAAPTRLDLLLADDNGAVNDDNVVSGGQNLTILGLAEAGSFVELFAGTSLLGTATTSSEGAFSVDIALPSGVTSITARATDSIGNVSALSAQLVITVDNTAPVAPTGLDLAGEDDDGNNDDDNVTDRTGDLTISGQAEAGSTVRVFVDGEVAGTTTADAEGGFSIDLDFAPGTQDITATATDQFGQTSAVSAPLTLTVARGPQAQNVSIDGNGDVLTIYFDEAIFGAPAFDQFAITDADGETLANVVGLDVNGTRATLYLDTAIAAEDGPRLSYTEVEGTVTDAAGNEAPDLANVPITNDTAFVAAVAPGIGLGKKGRIDLEGSEIVAFDPVSDRFFVTSGDGIQVIAVDENLNMTLLGTVELGSNEITSVAVANGVVAVAVADEVKTNNGRVFFLDADGDVGPGMVTGSVEVGALPDNVVFTPDGNTVLTANEGERTPLDDVSPTNPLVDPVGSVSIIDISGGVGSATVRTAGFGAFNDQLAELTAAGVRLFAGTPDADGITVAQDLEPEYIAVSSDGTEALVTLQEANAIAVIDIATATVIDIKPLGLKPYDGLPLDFSDRDDGYNPRTDNANVYGQFMPDTIASFTGGDGKTYYVIANEGDARDDFFDSPDGRVDDLNLDPTAFPNAAELQDDENLGRLEVTVHPGLDGDTDGDGDIDRILSYGGRSFSILNEDGVIVYDSGSVIEQFAATQGEFDGDDFPDTGVFNDSRSDAKGPEPEAITTGVFGDRVLAFVGLERGGGGVMVFDVTNPANVEFVTYMRDPATLAPEGLVYISAEDSPTGKAVLAIASEGDDPVDEDVGIALSVFELVSEDTFTLQLLHLADGEAKSLALDTAPNLAALVDAYEDTHFNSITLSGGDNYIPGLFATAQNQSSVTTALGFNGAPRVDIAIHNALGVQASTIGNHEFDRGSANFATAIRSSGAYPGALFPYLSANLDFSADTSLNPLFLETLGNDVLENAADLARTIVPSAVIEENGELIGIVGATTQVLASITSIGSTTVKGTNENDMQLLALQLQPYIDDLIAQGVNKIIVMSHLQQIALEQALAPLLEGVDIILAAGSNTRLSDADDVLVAFPGHSAVSQGAYPIVTAGIDGAPTLIVNTDNEYTYLGRLVVEFDADGEIILGSLDPSISGAYAATAENVAEAWNTTVDNLDETAFAEGTRGDAVRDLIAPVQAVLEVQGSNVYGFSEVYLQGETAFVRSEETNLGNLTADANAFAAREALGFGNDAVVVSYKNGGGIRAPIGSVTGTGSDVVLGPNEGGVVTQLDVGAALAFNNGLIVFETTAQGLLNILNSPNSFQARNGGFAQLSGVEVSYDPDLPAGSRVVDVALVDGEGNKIALVDDGVVVAGAPASITMVTLDFIAAQDGDGTQIAENGSNFRYLQADGTLSAPLGTIDDPSNADPADIVVNTGAFTGTRLREQQALEDYLRENFGTLETAFDLAETPAALDERIQNINLREDTVLDGTAPIMVETLLVETFA